MALHFHFGIPGSLLVEELESTYFVMIQNHEKVANNYFYPEIT